MMSKPATSSKAVPSAVPTRSTPNLTSTSQSSTSAFLSTTNLSQTTQSYPTGSKSESATAAHVLSPRKIGGIATASTLLFLCIVLGILLLIARKRSKKRNPPSEILSSPPMDTKSEAKEDEISKRKLSADFPQPLFELDGMDHASELDMSEAEEAFCSVAHTIRIIRPRIVQPDTLPGTAR